MLSAETIASKVKELGQQITKDYQNHELLLVAILKGASIFASDLMRSIDLITEIDFIAISSYGSTTKTSGVVRIVKDLDSDLTDRDVLIVEDIVDSGLTLSYLKRNLLSRSPRSLEICSLLVKEEKQRTKINIRYIGFEIPDNFVVGYGLDIGQKYRNLPDIHKLIIPERENPH
jgi:hypoxanthine phosphoribosyltransferase